jgi:hypothetical protein
MGVEVTTMPIHDWTRVGAGTWHAFHVSWISEIQLALNDGRMPPDYYAQAEQVIGPYGPDVLALQLDFFPEAGEPAFESQGGLAVKAAPPRPRMVAESEMADYARKRRTLTIRHASDDRIIALVELVSPGNKAAQRPFDAFVDKALEAIERGYHLLIVDLFPPTARDPQGLHHAIWGSFEACDYALPPESPLCLMAYDSGPTKRAYVEATAVGRELIEMPLFLQPEHYVNVPLEETYREAFRGVARKWKAVLQAQSC